MKKKKEIEVANEEQNKKDAYEVETELKGASLSAICMVLLAFIYYIYEMIKGEGSNPAFFSLITIYNAVLYGYKAYKSQKYRGLNIATSVIWGVMTLVLILSYLNVL